MFTLDFIPLCLTVGKLLAALRKRAPDVYIGLYSPMFDCKELVTALRKRAPDVILDSISICLTVGKLLAALRKRAPNSAVVVFLFLAGLRFTGAITIGPNFHPKLTLAAPTIGYSVAC